MRTHARREPVERAERRVEEAARAADVELVPVDAAEPDVVVVLGGDGTMLRALRATLGTRTPVFGVNFGRVGFLTSARADELDSALERVFAGDFRVVELATLRARLGESEHAAINDVVVTSARPGRMVELGWELGGEPLGLQPCDGMICCTPSGSTAYNLSNGGPVMMWGLEAMAMTFVAPHSLHTRPLVVPRGLDLLVTNRAREQPVTVLVDGHEVGALAGDGGLEVGVGGDRCRLALLPEVTFFSRYHDLFR
ncbi:MAG TPA: NAD(+)/NADH kinase [Gaiellaceae bacterium]|nr:NAD(+)/NADH kinase [Gaiellaceae bacterium]